MGEVASYINSLQIRPSYTAVPSFIRDKRTFMRIRSVRVENFRAIRLLELTDLPDAVVVAGPNGCGKSSLFDALRLLKSAYGQYHQNEYQSWFSEFQININRVAQESHRVLHNPSLPLRVQAEFELSDSEKAYLTENAQTLYRQRAWAQAQGLRTAKDNSIVVNPAVRRTEAEAVQVQVSKLTKAFEDSIDAEFQVAELILKPGQDPEVRASPIIELVFSVYKPGRLGVIDYHGPNRTYVRENVGSVNLTITETNNKRSQNALYNTQNKYRGVKSEMAQAFIRQMLAEKVGAEVQEEDTLKETLDELFTVFFPGKTFLGPQPTRDGGLTFPVRLENGREHDINELSSGEKEVLLGYLRLRNSAPHNSIILLDEPELHLNPRLVRGLPRFYQKHLGQALNNQIWLITHSDALLREAVEEPTYSVYHMRPSHTVTAGENQVDPVKATAGTERVVLDLVGDLATYSPRSKVVFVEGEVSDFDEGLIRELFPEFADRVNLISVGTKTRVRRLHDLLEQTAEEGRLDARFFSITDRDFDGPLSVEDERAYQWNVYHIENYLLEPKFIREVMTALTGPGSDVSTESEIMRDLKDCAVETVNDLVRIKMSRIVRTALFGCISIGYDPSEHAAKGLREAAERSKSQLDKVLGNELHPKMLQDKETKIRSELEHALQDDRWRRDFRGRDVLKRFVGHHQETLGVSYEKIRNLIINRMREHGYKPRGMERVIQKIENA